MSSNVSFEKFKLNFTKQVPEFEISEETDFGLGFDGSWSMEDSDVPGGVTRWVYARQLGEQLADAACQIDDDGIDVFTYTQHVTGRYLSQNMAGVRKALNSMPGGGTATHTVVQALYGRYKELAAKPGYNKKYRAYVITDGETDVDALARTIEGIANEIGAKVGKQASEKDYPFNLTFLSVGKDIPFDSFYRLDNQLNTEYDIVIFGGRLEALDDGADAV